MKFKSFKYNKKEKFWYYGDTENGIRIIFSEDQKIYMASMFKQGDFYGPFGGWNTLISAIDEMMLAYNKN